MSRKRPPVSVEDQALFLEAVSGATPLTARDRVPPPSPPAALVRRELLPPPVALAVDGDGQRYAARAPGVSLAQIADLRRGQVHVEDTLDLHGETIDRGITHLRTFLVEANRIGRRCVLVVHGRGTHSDHGAPLREAVLADLLGACSGLVRALSTAAPSAGGDGATYVMLRGLR